MYYDPMISKLITYGKDRTEALDLMNVALDEYVVQGVTDNLGFCKSIINNESFKEGKYDTSFIEHFYPEGYHGDKLTNEDELVLALAAA
jgi:acetyl/propionyl-CoA carboxylase alpha subunit